MRVSHLRDERQRGELRAAGLADEVHAGGIAAVLLRMVQHPPDPSIAVAQHVQHRALWQAAENHNTPLKTTPQRSTGLFELHPKNQKPPKP